MFRFSTLRFSPSVARSRSKRAFASGPVLRLRQEDPEAYYDGEEVLFNFRNTPRTEVRRIDSLHDLNDLLSGESAVAAKTTGVWARQGWAQWVGRLLSELSPKQQMKIAEKHSSEVAHPITTAEHMSDLTLHQWTSGTQFANDVLTQWMHGKRLNDILAISKELGQLDMPAGYVLEGDYVQEIAAAEDVTFDRLLPMLRGMKGVKDWVSLTAVRSNNCFERRPCNGLLDKLKPREGSGSLNTSCKLSDGEGSGVDLLDEYHRHVGKTICRNPSVALNPHMYLIWKFPHYVTEYHQDTHQMPHITLYNQVSGVSTFHFLPVLAGLFATHVGKQRGMVALSELLTKFDERGIGSVASINPGQMAMILPFGSHGVFVPSPALNPDMPGFEVSVIRAAELYLTEAQKLCEEQVLHGVVPESCIRAPKVMTPQLLSTMAGAEAATM